jgi:hypothetical protein
MYVWMQIPLVDFFLLELYSISYDSKLMLCGKSNTVAPTLSPSAGLF